MQEPFVDFTYPEDELEVEQNHYREASRHFLRVINVSIDHIARADTPRREVWAVAHALGLAMCEGVSITDRAWELGVSPQALSKSIKEFQNKVNI